MSYTLSITRRAQKELADIHPTHRERIINSIQPLAENPNPPGCKKLTGRDAWRIRVGNYRVIYEINNNELIVTVINIGHRREVYR